MTRPVHELELNELRDAAEIAVTIAAAARAGVFRALAAGGATPAELAGRLGVDARAVGILLPALAEWGLVAERDGEYVLTRRGRSRLADPDSPEYAAGGLAHWLRGIETWTRLPEVLRTGRPADRDDDAKPTDEGIARFMAAMAAAPAARIRRVVELCLERVPEARTALDLGGGPGLFARELAGAGLEVTLLDRPEVIEHVRHAYGLTEVARLRLATGDFLEDPLPAGPFDLVLLSNILHIYSPAENRALLGRIGEVTAPGGAAAVADFVRGRSPRAARFGLMMLLRTERGNAYTAEEYRVWLEDAGFGAVRVEDVDGADRQLITAVRR